MIKTTKLCLSTIFLVLITISYAGAFGVGSFYNENSPLAMSYGETKTIDINVQNMIGDEDITVKLEIKQGSDIATLEQDTYVIKSKTSDTMIPLKITVPENYASPSQRIEVETKIVTTNQQGMVILGTGYKTSFDVILSKKEQPASSSSLWLIIILVAILILVIAILVILKKRK